ncbi:MAG: divalent cation tolerance protein CutA [Candidatus Krumholzibacteria bacterium]|jgi:uncharacterized protein involved in tolerance to divalent cations|nr:divalent cation tolerance protein CutA [Candidatus Krumholzibacteria bacterium]MDP6668299.1 divalent cation tolerance protein CutA [Candidatus Krumholzibacteria bacterium]MDP6796522.1 divalent cation tolerance protein CutA [Candidatus Krumholzibacteria bacterium]MDP7022103.1 divalent cation tolerance protein CutA [Candidatus Krumholzibacteria bacterium]
MRPSDLNIILSSAPDMEMTETLARRLVEARLVPCAQILPKARSLYFWN